MANTQPSPAPPSIVFHRRPKGPAGAYTVEKLTTLLEKFAAKLGKHSPVQTIEVFLDQPKNPVGKVVAFGVMLHLHLWSGARYVASAEHYVAQAKHLGLEACVRETMKELSEQLRRKRR